jgi:hypothetical protein
MDPLPQSPMDSRRPSELDIDMSAIDSQFLLSDLDLDMGGLEGLEEELAKGLPAAAGESPSKQTGGRTPVANENRPSLGPWANTLGAGAEWDVEDERQLELVEILLDWDGEEGSVGELQGAHLPSNALILTIPSERFNYPAACPCSSR